MNPFGGGGGDGGILSGVGVDVPGTSYVAVGTNRVKPAYASLGTVVPFTPRGSDRYPYMLAKEEAVINARSAKANPQLVGQLQNASGPISSPEIVKVIIMGGDDMGRAVERSMVVRSVQKTGRVSVAVGQE